MKNGGSLKLVPKKQPPKTKGSLFKLLEPAKQKPLVLYDHSQLEREIDANEVNKSIEYDKTFNYVHPDKFGPKHSVSPYNR